MRSDVNVKMEYSEDMLMDISRSNLPYGQIKERMAWVAHMNSLTTMAEETVLKELVYS